jgi:hypothetical protein
MTKEPALNTQVQLCMRYFITELALLWSVYGANTCALSAFNADISVNGVDVVAFCNA